MFLFFTFSRNAFHYLMLCAIWYNLYNLRKVKNSHGGVLLLLKLQSFSLNFTMQAFSLSVTFSKVVMLLSNVTKSNTSPWVFFFFLDWANDTKSRKASHIWF